VFQKAGIQFSTLIEDVQSVIDAQEAERLLTKFTAQASTDDAFFNDSHDFEELVFETQKIAALKPDLVTFIPSIGTSIQGRDLVAVWIYAGPERRVSSGVLGDIPTNVPKIWFNGGQHAREWVSPATTMYIYYQLVTRYGVDPDVTTLLEKVGFVIVPVVNPDGYDWSWTNSRLWRKNRRANTGGSFGVDLNRNWDDHWCQQGASRTPSSDTYCGTAPFSEPETRSVSTFLKSLSNVKVAIDIHSYSQLLLRPYGWTSTPPPNDRLLFSLGAEMATRIRAVSGLTYANEGSWELYYTTGSADDWAYSKANISIVYTFELRDTGRYGFLLPANQIIPNGQEIWAALWYLSQYVYNNLPLAKK